MGSFDDLGKFFSGCRKSCPGLLNSEAADVTVVGLDMCIGPGLIGHLRRAQSGGK